MPAYNVYLANLGNALTSGQQNTVRTTLQGWFNQIATGSSYSGATVQWVTATFSIQNYELLLYFVPNEISSIVRSLPGFSGPAGTGDAYTVWAGNLSASEIYVNKSRNWLAEIAFHEAMHNKLHLSDTALHARDGLARIPVSAGSQPSALNISQMRTALSNVQAQWTGGWAAYSDPLAGLGL